MGNTLTKQVIDGREHWQMPAPKKGDPAWNVWIPTDSSISVVAPCGTKYYKCTDKGLSTDRDLFTPWLPEEAYMYDATGSYVKNPNWIPTPFTETTYRDKFCQYNATADKWIYNYAKARPDQNPLKATTCDGGYFITDGHGYHHTGFVSF